MSTGSTPRNKETPSDLINNKLAELGLKFDVLPVDSLHPYKANNKKHGQKDLSAIYSSIQSFGFSEVVICDKDLEIIAGHGRVLAAKEAGINDVPVLICEKLDKNQAKAYRLAHNRTANIAKYNDDVIIQELNDLKQDGFPLEDISKTMQLEKWMNIVDEPTFDLETYESPTSSEMTAKDVPDALFPTDNDWDVPVLSLKMQADYLDAPVYQWGDTARKIVNRGTWHFYTTDSKFEALWKDPTGPLQSGAPTIIEPNFSTGPQFPKASGMCMIYRKRWLSRFWQENGKRIMVDIDVHEKLYDIALLGVPKEWRSFATRGYRGEESRLLKEFQLVTNYTKSDDLFFVVYGGGHGIESVCKENGWVWIEARERYTRDQYNDLIKKQIENEEVITK